MSKTISLLALKKTLSERKKNGDTWAGMGREYDVNPAVLWRIVHDDYEPRREDLRDKLGLPETIRIEITRDALGRFASHE